MNEAIDGWMMDVSCNSLLDITLLYKTLDPHAPPSDASSIFFLVSQTMQPA